MPKVKLAIRVEISSGRIAFNVLFTNIPGLTKKNSNNNNNNNNTNKGDNWDR